MRVPKEFIKSLQGKEFVLMGGLLELAHQDGLNFTNTEILQFPSDTNGQTTIVRAIVRTGKGEFSGIGDASPASVPNKSIAVHSIRMAETRAIARALRVATNVSMTAFEELGEFNDDYKPDFSAGNQQAKKTGYTPKPAPAAPTVAKNTTVEVQAEKPAADPTQRDEIRALSEKLGMDGTALQKKLKGLNLSWKTLSNEDAANVIVMLEAEVNAQKA